ncbi:nucleotide-binding universal stress UspA family protein [Pseudoduganella flava]|uniref:Nucleotide-binding universal stress UspA family protein n=1 Tax=Pseudoduganella flava TaxID=871742 RepID=A0A562PL75_9BURK|nr:universal stress protein [Pseudoduganella flava]QGZ41076.1 universal stress protein [Pseudoduganella flava]TWI45221.1 nucleotide-binding universal stress UspA family protein [Pseudoduganella flava]
MFKNILLPTDGSPLSEKATATAVQFAKVHGARIVGVCVAQPFPFVPLSDGGAVVPDAEVFETQLKSAAQTHLAKVAAACAAGGVPFEGVVGNSHNPYEEIVKAAEKHNCDIIVMASHGRKGLNKLFLGSETQKVLAHTTLPVLVLR